MKLEKNSRKFTIYKIEKKEVPPFKLMCIGKVGRVVEIEIKALSIKKHLLGTRISFTRMDGQLDVVRTDMLLKHDYIPDKLRALHYQIMHVSKS